MSKIFLIHYRLNKIKGYFYSKSCQAKYRFYLQFYYNYDFYSAVNKMPNQLGKFIVTHFAIIFPINML